METNYVVTDSRGWKHDVRASSHFDAGVAFLGEHPDEDVVTIQSEAEAIQSSLDKGHE